MRSIRVIYSIEFNNSILDYTDFKERLSPADPDNSGSRLRGQAQIKNMGKYSVRHNRSGFALIFVFFFVILVAGIVLAYLNMNSQSTANVGIKQTEMQTFYAAEGAQARAVQYLQLDTLGIWNTIQPAAGALGTYGPITENLWTYQSISYDFIVDNWNLAYRFNPVPFGPTTASTTPLPLPAGNPMNAIDGAVGTFWLAGVPRSLTIDFPAGSNYTINEFRIRSTGPAGQRPSDYTWDVNINGSGWQSTGINVSGNNTPERMDFVNPPLQNVIGVRINITNVGNVRINEIEIPWVRIRSRCRINNKSGTSYTEKYIRSCVLNNGLIGGTTAVFKITPSTLPGTNITSIWDEISYDTYTTPSDF
ncbi:MAG: hypothetical protein HY920_04280 [Elusimicrobia bacterium]|nr:hypothetical protein [Elusimicrobiota bacterium]